MEFTDIEKQILELMFDNFSNTLEILDSEVFSKNDLFKLAQKLNINY